MALYLFSVTKFIATSSGCHLWLRDEAGGEGTSLRLRLLNPALHDLPLLCARALSPKRPRLLLLISFPRGNALHIDAPIVLSGLRTIFPLFQ